MTFPRCARPCKNFLGDLSNSGPTVRPENEGGANGLPGTTI